MTFFEMDIHKKIKMGEYPAEIFKGTLLDAKLGVLQTLLSTESNNNIPAVNTLKAAIFVAEGVCNEQQACKFLNISNKNSGKVKALSVRIKGKLEAIDDAFVEILDAGDEAMQHLERRERRERRTRG